MIPKPTTRTDALKNAIQAAEMSYEAIERSPRMYPSASAALAQAWADIAALLPDVAEGHTEKEVFGPGESVHTHDCNGSPLKFTVMRNGDLVLEHGERDITRQMVSIEPVKRRVSREGRVSRVATGTPITQDALRILWAIVAAKVIHSTEHVHTMAVTDVNRYAKESLTVTVTGSHYQVSSP